MIFTFQLGLSTMTLLLSLLLIGWQSWAFWVVGLLTVLQMIFSYLFPKYWVGWKKLAKQGLLITLGLAEMAVAVLVMPDLPLLLLLAMLVQTSVYAFAA